MSGEFFFMAVGALGVALAGFAGLIATFGRRQGELEPAQSWRIANIVVGGAVITLTGYGTIAIHLLVEDQALTVRISSALLVLFLVFRGLLSLVPGPSWEGYERRRRFYTMGFALVTLATATNVFLASVGFLALLMVVILLDLFGIFMNAVDDFTGSGLSRDEGS